MTELARLIEAHNLEARRSNKVDIGANHNMTTDASPHQPKTGLEAKFSMEFCLAILLLEGKAGLGQILGQSVQRFRCSGVDPQDQFLNVDPEAENAGFDKMTSILKVHLRGRSDHPPVAHLPRAVRQNPMSFDEQRQNSGDAQNSRNGQRRRPNK